MSLYEKHVFYFFFESASRLCSSAAPPETWRVRSGRVTREATLTVGAGRLFLPPFGASRMTKRLAALTVVFAFHSLSV